MNLNAAVRIKVSKSVSFSGDPKDHQIHRTLRKKIDFNFLFFWLLIAMISAVCR